eukprot:g6410.t1
MPNPKERKILPDLIAGSIGGGVGMVFGHPLDLIKARMMNDSVGMYRGMIDCLRKTFAHEGFGGFFKGIGPPLASVAIYQAVAFVSFSTALSLVSAVETEAEAPIFDLFLAGTLSGVATVAVTTPTDLLKIRLQLQRDAPGKAQYKSMFDAAKQITRSGGLNALYQGTVATLWRDSWSTGLYFSIYHVCKREFERNDLFQSQTASELLAGGISGAAAWGSIVPLDVIKTRVQADLKRKLTMRSAISNLLNGPGGVRQFYRGTLPLILRAFLVNAVTFYAYEETWRQIERVGVV